MDPNHTRPVTSLFIHGRARAACWLVSLVVAISLLHPSLTQAQPLGFIVDAVFGNEKFPGQFNRPWGVAVDNQDRIIVSAGRFYLGGD